jgi:hypothetical protein
MPDKKIVVSLQSKSFDAMTVVSTQDFVANHNRYFDLAVNEQVIVKRGDTTFSIVCNADTMQEKQKILQPDDDFRRAITMEQLREQTYEVIDKFFANK